MKGRPGSREQRGVTLVEVLAVAAIIGVLAALATVGYGRWIASSRMAEATGMVSGIKNAQENFFTQTGRYLTVTKDIKPPTLYPAGTPKAEKLKWGDPCPSSICATGSDGKVTDWTRLGIASGEPVWFSYGTVAGIETCDPDCAGITFTTSKGAVKWPAEAGSAITRPWFIVSAMADTNGNGKYASVVGASFSARLIVDNEGE